MLALSTAFTSPSYSLQTPCNSTFAILSSSTKLFLPHGGGSNRVHVVKGLVLPGHGPDKIEKATGLGPETIKQL
jgi:hypothetical protein